jgi:hypothetical protein
VTDAPLPETLTLDDAYRAAFYLRSDPARWEDWKCAVRRAIGHDAPTDPLTEDLYRDE